MKSVSLPSLVLTSASIQVPSFVLWEMVQSPYKLKPLQPGGLVAGNTLYVSFILISVKSLIGYITVKIVMLIRDNGNTCVWQALFSAARSMSQTLTAA